MPAPSRLRHSRHDNWPDLPDDELLKVRFCDLRLSIDKSTLATDISQLYTSLHRRGITFRPHVWLSTEWFSPDGIPGIAIPFYVAHPRLMQLERHMKGEAEGGSRFWRQRILRHEAGHALDTAFGLRRRPGWRDVFGRASRQYPRVYSARPASRRYVQHLGHWYAQSHPTEDFAETFAVWLQPRARWRRDYAGWPALEKLEYVDEIMAEVAAKRPRNTLRETAAPLRENRRTLQEHYRRSSTIEDLSERRYDSWLLRSFPSRGRYPDAQSLGAYLREAESALRESVLKQTGAGGYLFRHVSAGLRRRAHRLELVVPAGRRDARHRAARIYIRVIADVLRRNRERYVL